MSRVLLIILSACLFNVSFAASLQPNKMCFSRTYTAEHMAKSKNSSQSLKAISAVIDYDPSYSYLNMKGISAQGGLEYSFWGDLSFDSKSVFCARFSADGDENIGCASAELKDGSQKLVISPVSRDYFNGYEQTYSAGVRLNRCEGETTDGEGCHGTFKTLYMLSTNQADHNYTLNRVNCSQ